MRRDLLGELDVVEHNQGPLDVEDGPVVDSGRDVVVSGHSLDVYFRCRCHLLSCSVSLLCLDSLRRFLDL